MKSIKIGDYITLNKKALKVLPKKILDFFKTPQKVTKIDDVLNDDGKYNVFCNYKEIAPCWIELYNKKIEYEIY